MLSPSPHILKCRPPCDPSRSVSLVAWTSENSTAPLPAGCASTAIDVFFPFLGVWEMLIGMGLLVRSLNRTAILLLFLQVPGTMLPLVLLPEVCFTQFPLGLTMEGQYVVKNLVLIAAAIVVGGTVRQPKSPAA